MDLIASSVEHHPSLRELTVEGGGLCSESLVKGAVEGMAKRRGVEKLVVTPCKGECFNALSLHCPLSAVLRK